MPTATFTPNSQQFDATRDEIIASFRQKIQQEARRKLSQVQLHLKGDNPAKLCTVYVS